MRRLFYVAFGATVGVLVVRRVSNAAAKWTPEGLAGQASGVGGRVAEWWAVVQEGAAEREVELREALGIDGDRELRRHEVGRDRRALPALLRRTRARRSSRRRRWSSTTRRCCSSTPGWCRSSRTSSARSRAPYERATSVQKCVRTGDIDIVGTNTRNLSFFQMAGNFSFGDYFKKRAIRLAWELLTSSAGRRRLRLRPGAAVGRRSTSTTTRPTGSGPRRSALPPERVQRRGKEDNYWRWGCPGPCGPCSEIYYDRGPEYGAEGGPIADEERYLEVWNLVFMQYVRGEGPRLGRLRHRRRAPDHATSTPAWASTGWRCCCRASTTSSRPTCCSPMLDWRRAIAGVAYGAEHDSDVRLRVDRRPHPHRDDADRRRCRPRQRGPRLRAAPDDPPYRPDASAARASTSRRSATW